MEIQAKHTLIPWHVSTKRDGITINEALIFIPFGQEANAAFIVKVCKSHEALVEACNQILSVKYHLNHEGKAIIEKALKQADEKNVTT